MPAQSRRESRLRGKRLWVEVLLAGAHVPAAPEPLPVKDLVEADLWDQLPAHLSDLLALLPQADLYRASMRSNAPACKLALFLLAIVLSALHANAQTVPPLEKIQNQAELDKTIATLDADLFDSYNRCDLEKFSSFFVDNVEFYHDQGGVTLGNADLTDSVKKTSAER